MTKEEYSEIVHSIKGDFIGRMSTIEILMCLVMASRINKNEIKFLMFVLNKLTFRHKKESLEYIINGSDLKKHLPSSLSDFLSDLGKMQDIRNIMAHSTVVPSKIKEYEKSGVITFMGANSLNKPFKNYSTKDHIVNISKLDSLIAVLDKMSIE